MFEKNNFSLRKYKPLKVLSFIAIFAAIFTLVSFFVMFLWNTILPSVANVKPLSFWKAAGLLILAKILFGGLPGRRSHGKKAHKPWKNKWMQMDPEERQQAKMRWKEYCNQKNSDKEKR